MARWVDAGELLRGDWLTTSAGTLVQVTAIQHTRREQTVHNLTVADTHTYYVSAGTNAILVHNCGVGANPGSEVASFYPTNNGFLGAADDAYLLPGQLIDRYGGSGYSKFFSPQGTPAEMRALPPGVAEQPLRTFEVMKPFPVQSGTVAPAFNQPGLGTQYLSPARLGVLLRHGILRGVN